MSRVCWSGCVGPRAQQRMGIQQCLWGLAWSAWRSDRRTLAVETPCVVQTRLVVFKTFDSPGSHCPMQSSQQPVVLVFWFVPKQSMTVQHNILPWSLKQLVPSGYSVPARNHICWNQKRNKTFGNFSSAYLHARRGKRQGQGPELRGSSWAPGCWSQLGLLRAAKACWCPQGTQRVFPSI